MGFATLQDFLGDRILFRNLNALDLTLPRLDDLRHDLMLPPISFRAKLPDYAASLSNWSGTPAGRMVTRPISAMSFMWAILE
jgi:hypothetical protein